ncbi:hypothetical protein A33M_0181 [Rhodovulum sp. PH10]|nr:hypothetical protein A33M_0181 [Rhodovulum sp. PH10]
MGAAGRRRATGTLRPAGPVCRGTDPGARRVSCPLVAGPCGAFMRLARRALTPTPGPG